MIGESEWVEIDDILSAALDLPRDERDRWLDAICSGRPQVRARVERLVALAEGEDRLLPVGERRRILVLLQAFSNVTGDGTS